MSSKNNRFNQSVKTSYTEDAVKEEASIAAEQSSTATTVTSESSSVQTGSSTPMVQIPKQEPAPLALKTPPTTNQEKTMNTPPVKMLPVQTELLALSHKLSPTKPVDGRWQYSLFELIRNTIEKEQPEGFDRVWSSILMFFHRSKGSLFSETHILRMGDNWPGSENDFSLYRRMIHVITQTANPETRMREAALINMSLATTHLSEEGRNRVISFYG